MDRWTSAVYGDLSFTLPPLTLKFRPIGDSYSDSGANATLPSGYSRQPIAEMRTPAWVEETVPLWLGATSPLEVAGHIDYHFSEVITPPLQKHRIQKQVDQLLFFFFYLTINRPGHDLAWKNS